MKRDDFDRALPEVFEKMKSILAAKSHDYAGEDDRFSNFRLCEMAGIPTWKGIAIRLSDKLSRILCFAKQEECKVKDESVEDTLIDLANYAILCLFAYRETKEKPALRSRDDPPFENVLRGIEQSGAWGRWGK